MIEYTSGNILHADAEALVNTVNCVGVMGRGIALQFKNAYPDNFKAYAAACQKKEVQPGQMFVFETRRLDNPKYIINFPTKRHWRGKSRIQDIESGLVDLVSVLQKYNISSIAVPPLGSGLGGLEWEEVRALIEKFLSELSETMVLVYEPKGSPSSDQMVHSQEVPNMTPGRAALIELISRYLNGLLDPQVSLLEVHKLMYFMQEAGEPLRLKFKPAHYGPYAENLRHVLKTIEGHFVSGYSDGGDAPEKVIELVPGAEKEAVNFLSHHESTRSRFSRVSELVEGFESPFGLELLSTVHWVAKSGKASSTQDIINCIHSWNDRKRQFTPRQIEIALRVLSQKGWVQEESMAN